MSLSDILVFEHMAPFTWKGIATAIASGAIVGLERQIRGKPVGIRTSALITLGTYVFLVSAKLVMNDHTDASRIIGQVNTGNGFLGAGVMLAKDGVVVGVTSAATIWMLAAIGVVAGLGLYPTAFALALIVVVVLVGVDLLEESFQSLTRGVHQKYDGWRKRRADSNEP